MKKLGRGIRTRFSDDLLWLVYITEEYINFTGNYGILDIETNYLQGATLRKKPNHMLSPFPLFPTVLNPSFQSPEPILGNPFSPKFNETQMDGTEDGLEEHLRTMEKLYGSLQNEECKIDSITQSWAVISGVGDNDKKYISMESLENHLIDKENGIIKLLDPPFNQSSLEPGYIKAYLPGTRENGGSSSFSIFNPNIYLNPAS